MSDLRGGGVRRGRKRSPLQQHLAGGGRSVVGWMPPPLGEATLLQAMGENHRTRLPQASDLSLFASDKIDALRAAVRDLSWLLSRGYADAAALTLVGNRYGLNARQRKAVQRSACSDATLRARSQRQVGAARICDAQVDVDGFNCLILVESLLLGAPVFRGRDGALRDLAGVHGAWRQVSVTATAVRLLANVLASAALVRWWLDRPVSMSGRLAALLVQEGAEREASWDVHLVDNPDTVLAASDGIVATADGWIQDQCGAWTDLPAGVAAGLPGCWILELGKQKEGAEEGLVPSGRGLAR